MNVQVVSFHCVLKDKLGKVISSTFNHDVITYDEGQKDMLKGLVRGLQNLRKGEKRRICLSAEEAYGYYDMKKVRDVSRKEFPEGAPLHVGEQVILSRQDGTREMYRIIQISESRVTLDGNHPLAGRDLIFEIEATDVRDATPEEIVESRTERKVVAHQPLH